MNIRVIVTGRSYHTAEQLPESISLDDGAKVDDAIEAISKLLPDGETLPASCLVAISTQHLGTLSSHENRELREGDEVTLIAPVAGG